MIAWWLYDVLMFPLGWLGLNRLRRRLVAQASGRTLEVGTGSGLTLPWYPAAASPIVAVDTEAEALRWARSRGPRAALVKASVEALPFADGSFETVVCSLVFCSVDRPPVGLAEIRRVLQPQGGLRMLEHVRPPGRLLGWLARLLTPVWRRLAGNCHLDRRTQEELPAAGLGVTASRQFLRGAGLALEARPAPLPAAAVPEPPAQPSAAPGTRQATPPAPSPVPVQAAAAPVVAPLDDTLDLQAVNPAEVRTVLLAYLQDCGARGIHEVRLVHGKGASIVRLTVSSTLARSPLVDSSRTADEAAGGRGVTLVRLKRA